MSGRVEREFLGWERSVVDCVVERLMAGYRGGELDLSQTLFVVPTAEAGRRLREALAFATGALGGGAVVPHVWVPERLLLTEADRALAGSRFQSWMAWTRVLGELKAGEAVALFGAQRPANDWRWALATAELMMELASTLGAGGLSFASLLASGQVAGDAARWADLASLEACYLALLEKEGVRDVSELKSARAASPWLPEGVVRVWVLAAPDMVPLVSRWLAAAAERWEVRVAVLAPERLAVGFDESGRPLPGFWEDAAGLGAVVRLEEVQVVMDSAGQASAVAEAVAELALRGQTAVGVCDAEVSGAVLERLVAEGVRVFEPGGVGVKAAGLWHVVGCFHEVLRRESWRAFAALLRVDEVRLALVGSAGTARLVQEADDFAAEHMPVTLGHARDLLAEAGALRSALDAVWDWRCHAAEADNAEAMVRQLLLWIYGERSFAPTSPLDRLNLDLAETLIETAAEVDAEVERFLGGKEMAERLGLILDIVADKHLAEPRGEVDLVLQGWLELLWEQAPCLVVAGLNEESVPGILISHPFLPDGLREKLGLPCQASRYARDAYLLHALSAQRGAGQLRLICGQWSERGDALRPSRLLMRCADEELAARVAHLFPREEEKKALLEPPRSLTWKLRPPTVAARKLETISPSRLALYLKCPFGYYLEKELGWGRAVDAGKREMDAMEFGNLIHYAVERMAKDEVMRRSERAGELADYLEAIVEERARELWGAPLPMLLRLQVEGARQRLRAVADSEVASRQDGWQIMDAEVALGEPDDGAALVLAGARLRGKIDRVESRDLGGKSQLRILDFKTGDSASKPMQAHLANVSARARLREEDEWMRVEDRDGKTWHQWTNLQLPLYAAAMNARGLGVPEVGYFCVPKAVQEVGVVMWPEFDEWWLEQAQRMAEEVVNRINQAHFWPPRDQERAGDAPFFGDVLAAVDAAGFTPEPKI